MGSMAAEVDVLHQAGKEALGAVSVDATWHDPGLDEAALGWARPAWDALAPFSAGGVYLDFAGLGGTRRSRVTPPSARTQIASTASAGPTTRKGSLTLRRTSRERGRVCRGHHGRPGPHADEAHRASADAVKQRRCPPSGLHALHMRHPRRRS